MLNQYRYYVGQFQVSWNTFKLTGSDVVSFLQNQSTYNMDSFSDQSFHLVSFLDPQGRIECYGWLCRQGEEFLYHVPELLKDVASERLNRYLISEDVTIEGPFWEDWLVVIGHQSKNHRTNSSFSGSIFGDEALLMNSGYLPDVKIVDSDEVRLWQGLSGWPSFVGEKFQKELIVNLGLFDLSVSLNKGCYPGQETVSKIANRRGAAYSPVLIEVESPLKPGVISSFDKKIGEVIDCYQWENKFYLSASLLRDFRVERMKLKFFLNGEEKEGIVRYFPLLSGQSKDKAEELFFHGSESFKKDDLQTAETCFRLAIELEPTYADAYEALGVMLGRQERYLEAIDWMKELAKVDSSSVLAHSNMSLYLMKLGRIEEAEQAKSDATIKSFAQFGKEAKEKEMKANLEKAKLSEWEKRESMFKQVLEIDEEDTLANFGLGSIAVERGNWEVARDHLEKVLKADPQYSVAYLALGQTYKALGLMDKAKTTFTEGISVAAKKGDLMPANQMQAELSQF